MNQEEQESYPIANQTQIAGDKNQTTSGMPEVELINGDIERFRRTGIVTTAIVIIALLVTLHLWLDETHIIFAMPEFPQMGNCDDVRDETKFPRILEIFESREAAIIDCDYNLNLEDDYHAIKLQMVTFIEDVVQQANIDTVPQTDVVQQCIPRQDIPVGSRCVDINQDMSNFWNPEIRQVSVAAVVRMLMVVITPVCTAIFSFLRGTENSEFAKLYYQEDDVVSIIKRIAFSGLLAAAMTIIVYFGIDLLWFIFGRIVPMPIRYASGTGILFTTLVVGVMSFMIIHWVSEIRLSTLSVFASVILMGGLIAGILTTNHVWESGQTNAYSSMSEEAYSERLAFDVGDNPGSRSIFRWTLVTSGLLFIAYSIKLNMAVKIMKKLLQARKPKGGDSYFSDDECNRYIGMLKPNVMLGVGIIAGILMAMVGIFPTDGACLPIHRYPCIDIPEFVSDKAHGAGAYGGPLLMFFMILTYWYIGYPIKAKSVRELIIPYWISVTAFGVAIIMFAVGYKGLLDAFWLLFVAFISLAALFLIRRYLRLNEKPHYPYAVFNWLDHPAIHWSLIMIVGVVLARIAPKVMTTVTLEFVVLLAFSLFIYIYSLHTDEYIEELEKQNPAIIFEKAMKMYNLDKNVLSQRTWVYTTVSFAIGLIALILLMATSANRATLIFAGTCFIVIYVMTVILQRMREAEEAL